MSFPQSPVLQGQVVYEAHRGGFWDKVGSVLTSAGRILTSALPYLAEAASMYAPSLGNSSSQHLPNQTSYRTPTTFRQELVRPRLLSEPKSAPIARQMLDKLNTQQARMQAPAPDWSGMQARSRQILDEIASYQGLPSYEQFHRQHNIAYDIQPRQSALGIERFVQPPSQSTGFINEDYGQIVRNLSHAQSYVPTDLHQARQKSPSHEKRFKAQAQQAPLRNDPLEEYLKEKKSHEQNMRQIRASMRTPGIDNLVRTNKKPKPMPDNYFLVPKTGNIDLTRIVQADRPPSDSQLKQILHRADMELYEARTEFEKLEAQKKLQQVKESLAINMVGLNGLKNRDGYVIIGNQAYGQNKAIYKAIQDVEYFYVNGTHLPPLKYPTLPPENIDSSRHREVYPDITSQVNRELQSIVQELQKAGLSGVLLIKSNFPNNGKWDMQVNHGLPGQVALSDEQTRELLHDITYPDKISTRDQYAFFRGKVRKAGYLSNFVYGYAIGALSTPKGLSDLGAYYANAKSGQIGDNPDDIRAMHEGYEAYWKDHTLEKRDWYNY